MNLIEDLTEIKILSEINPPLIQMLLLKMSKRAWAEQPEIRELWPSVSGKVIYPKYYTNLNEIFIS